MSPSSSKRTKACITTPTKISLPETAGIAWAADIFPSWQGGCTIPRMCAESISSSVCLLAGRKLPMPYPCWFSCSMVLQWCLTTAERSPGKMLRSVKYVIMPPVCYLFSGKWQALIYFMNQLKKNQNHHTTKKPNQKTNQTKITLQQTWKLIPLPSLVYVLWGFEVFCKLLSSYGWPRHRKNNPTSGLFNFFVKREKIFMPKLGHCWIQR